MPPAAYDEIADWYAAYVTDAAAGFSVRVRELVQALLAGARLSNRCLDIGCGTGARAELMRELGWEPVGVDPSSGQLRYATQVMPVVKGDAIALPFGENVADAAVCILCHTDVPDYAAVVSEAARVLKPGGRFVHIGVHPCFAGAFADRSDPARVVVDNGYARRERRFDSFTPQGVRARVGAWHVPLAALLDAALEADLRLVAVQESAPEGGVADLLGFAAVKPRIVAGSR